MLATQVCSIIALSERQTEIFHLWVYSPDALSSRVWARQEPDTGSLVWDTGTQVLREMELVFDLGTQTAAWESCCRPVKVAAPKFDKSKDFGKAVETQAFATCCCFIQRQQASGKAG